MSAQPNTLTDSNPVWGLVDTYTTKHTHPSTHPSLSPSTLQKILEATIASDLPYIQCPPTLGKFLALQCKLSGARHALEVGTLGGYSATWMAALNPGLRVTTVEVDAKHAEVARKNFAAAGVADRVEVIVGKGVDVLPVLLEEVLKGKREVFDFAFIDADKENNWTYFDLAVKAGRSGMGIVVDNVVRRGRIVSEDPEVQAEEGVKGARKVIEGAGRDERVEAVVMQLVSEKSYDGFVFAVVN